MTTTVTVLECQRAYAAAMASGKTTEMTERAKQEDKATHAELNRLRAKPGNDECFDCTAQKPGWAVLPWGVYVCIDCAQVHRNLGRHISQTKAINTGTYLWYPHELRVMREVGNVRAARAFAGAPAKPSRDASAATKMAHARDKYELRKFGPVYAAPAAAEESRMTKAAVQPAAVQPAAVQPAAVQPAAVQPVAVQPVATAKKARPSGLAHAKKVPGASKELAIPDLISLDAVVAVVPPLVPMTPAPAELWQAFADVGATAVPEEEGPAFDNATPPGGDAVTAAWDQKKAAVLSLFPGASTGCHTQEQQRVATGSMESASFFAAYGL